MAEDMFSTSLEKSSRSNDGNQRWQNDTGSSYKTEERWCFVADVWKYILMMPDIYQDPILNTKKADIVYAKSSWS